MRRWSRTPTGFMARHFERPDLVADFAPPRADCDNAQSNEHYFNRRWRLRWAPFSVAAAIAADDRGDRVSCAFDPGWVRRRIGEAEIPEIAMGRCSRFLGRQCRACRHFWLHGAWLEPAGCLGLAVVARRFGRFRHVGVRGLRLLAIDARQGRRRRAVHLGLGGPRASLARLLDAASRRDFIYLVLILALFGKSSWFLLLAALSGRRSTFSW